MPREIHQRLFDANRPGSLERWKRKMQDVYSPSNKQRPKHGRRKEPEQEEKRKVATRKDIADLLRRLQNPGESNPDDD